MKRKKKSFEWSGRSYARRKKVKQSGTLYRLRSQSLVDAGFASYDEYLASDLWSVIRARVMERDGHKCYACHRPCRCVHHITYGIEVLLGNRDDQLISLCGGCHKYIEFIGDRKLSCANTILEKLIMRVRSICGGGAAKGAARRLMPRCRHCDQRSTHLDSTNLCRPCQRALLVESRINQSAPRATGKGVPDNRAMSHGNTPSEREFLGLGVADTGP